jgi:hypothetical protein
MNQVRLEILLFCEEGYLDPTYSVLSTQYSVLVP